MGRNIESKKIKVGDLDIHYLTGGQGDPLLVVHGGGDELYGVCAGPARLRAQPADKR
jgi:hypothetical protein